MVVVPNMVGVCDYKNHTHIKFSSQKEKLTENVKGHVRKIIA